MSKRLIYAEDAIEEIIRRLGIKDESYLTAQEKAVVQVLKDMPPTQPQDIARDIATIIENEKDMRVVLKNAEPQWIPVSERLPEEDGLYLVTTSKGQAQVHVFNHNGNSEEYWTRCNKAWMPLPEPYKGEQG